jgi:hypothetical protein
MREKTETKAEGRTKGRKETKPLAKGTPVTISQTDTGMPGYIPSHHCFFPYPSHSLKELGVVIIIRSTALRCTESGQRRSCCHCKSIHTVCIRSTISCTDQFVPRTYRMGDENQVLWCKEMKLGAI